MKMKNILAVTAPQDSMHFGFREFVESLPDETEVVMVSRGYFGKPYGRSSRFQTKDIRDFYLMRVPSDVNPDLDYFVSGHEAVLREIPDKLVLRVALKQQNTMAYIGAKSTWTEQGSIDDMLEAYDTLASVDARVVLLAGLQTKNPISDSVIQKTWFGLGTSKVLPTYITIGLKSADGRYLLKTTGQQGPIEGTYKGHL